MPFLAPVAAAIGTGLAAVGGGSALAGAATVGLAGASIYSGIKGAGAAKAGTRAQIKAGERALDVQLQMFREQQAAQEPFREVGLAATNKLAGLFGVPQSTGPQPQGLQAAGRTTPGTITPERGLATTQQTALQDFQTSPGYQFRQQEGQRAVERGAAARGGLLSGKGLRGVTEVSQGIASQEFGNYVNALQSLAGLGPVAATQQNIARGTLAANQSNVLQQQGAARASGFAQQNQAFQTGLQGATDVIGFGLGLGNP